MSGFHAQPAHAGQAKEEGGLVKDTPRSKFLMFYNPTDWVTTSTGELRPTITHHHFMAGSGATSPDGDFTPEQIRLQRAGFIALPFDAVGVGTDYVLQYKNRHGKPVCRTIFQAPYTDATGNTRWAMDDVAWSAFIRLLRAKGVIKAPEPMVIEGLLKMQRKLLNERRAPRTDDGEQMERYLAKVEQSKRVIASLEKELEASIAIYGRPESPASSGLLEQINEQLSAIEGAEAGVKVETTKIKDRVTRGKGGRPARGSKNKTPSPEPEAESVDEDDEE